MPSIAAARRSLQQLDIASRAAVLSFSTNAVLMALKLTIGLVFGSIAVLGDGVDSAEDVFASGLAFFTVRLALQPADEAHPYGHGKAESLAAMSQAALIAGGATFIAIAAIRRLVTRDTAVAVTPSLITMGIAVVVNIGVAWYSLRAARASGSIAIAADARHLLTNVVQAGAVIAGLGLVGVTGNRAWDPAVALALAAYLLWVAWGIGRTALQELVDTALPAETVGALQACLAHESHGMRGYHELRTRKSGRETYIDLHVLVDPAITVSEAHELSEDLERDVQELVPGAVVTIHIDPDEPGAGNGPKSAAAAEASAGRDDGARP
ncbi:MAG TPA: cation diffusion facilitator family transporter [Dehalococcoidia bacterium]|nr:cation diffusion facilitator family transporter [Dehalococcoidia bacterium]